MRFLQFILSHSIFIAFCAAGLCYQTITLLHISHDINIYGFIFFSTLCGYNFYWLLSKFYFSDRKLGVSFLKRHSSFLFLFLIAVSGTAYFLLKEIHLLPLILISVLLTLLYSLPLWPFSFSKKLQRAGFFKTTLLSLAWTYVTVVLPAASVLQTMQMPVIALFTARFFFMLLLCIIFDMRDVSVDKLHGLHSLATDLTRKTLHIIVSFVILFYIAAGIFVRYYFYDDAQIIAFAFTGTIVILVYLLSLKRRGYLFYYFLVDGLMLLSAFGTFASTQC